VPGHLIEVAYDPADRSRVALDVDERFRAPPARFLKTRPPDQPAPAAPAADDQWSSLWDRAGGDDGHVRELERLAALRDRGALSQEEFEREKARVLGGTDAEPRSAQAAASEAASNACSTPARANTNRTSRTR
jgi:hypothetical protein